MSEKGSNFKTLKYALYFAVLCLAVGPWLTILRQEFGIGVAGTGIIGIGTYFEFLPRFQGNFFKRLVGVLLTFSVAVVEIIYMFLILALFRV
ncbi:hypothetical protein [Pediococcus ethanolidurans]|uniref:hypothetical protein n=1 Tax=Pediococcus ethanolidurans TaxID=319653 RepID=UPI001C1ED357|nr:hypothetical protein [Pediococcus ethanolidurans]MBU7555631.1 hypothetical protein [Pediococcus ethanolidurans]MCT4397166.1 hypothetical protein [Pediococcus ethanolidurans]MCV3322337.1 hypothetical protein [Pediococcus ethanolidurans]MCV3323119.1 hypothetical protein [Pediococcus ethanolidurans]MCV3327093.1 hypothetical protein [Pediococcus ethanolidurans]